MPIIRVTALPQPVNIDVTCALRNTCFALAKTMGISPDDVWAIWHLLQDGDYLQGANGPQIQPASSHPPLVELMALEGRSPELMAKMLTCVGTVLCAELGLQAGNVYVRYVEMRKAMVFFGGTILDAK